MSIHPSNLRCEDDDNKLGSDNLEEGLFLDDDDRSSALRLAPLPPLFDGEHGVLRI